MMQLKNSRRIVAAAAGAVLLAGCQDLVVENTNSPDRFRALSDPASVETLIVGSWRDKWARLHNTTTGYNVMPLVAEEFTATYANDAALELSSEPRVAFNNNPISDAHGVARFHWESFYRANANATEGLGAIRGGLRIRTGTGDAIDQTTRAWAFAKWMQAIAHGSIALTHDQGFVVSEYTDIEDPRAVPMVSHVEVRDSAIKFMMQAIDTLNARNIVFPETWIPTRAYTSAELARIGHSYIARWLVYGARTPAERAAVDWNRVISHVDQGVRADYIINLESGNVVSNLFNRIQNAGTFAAWADYRLVGPADISGNFANWLNTPVDDRERFLITTPDRRITGATPTSHGSYFRYRADNIMVQARGTYHNSHYQWYRHRYQYGTPTTFTTTGYAPLMTVDEMNLIKAEALARLGRGAEAATLVNITRTRPQRLAGAGTPVPNLPPITAAGVPQSADCVPRIDGVNCADLLGAIMYERMIEAAALDSWRAWQDSRGWGRLPAGTFVNIPVPARELQALGMEIYSFGGIGGEGGAVCNIALCK
jgi:hypothetical protein